MEALDGIAAAHRILGDLDAALRLSREARAAALALEDPYWIATTAGNLGFVHEARGEFEEALAAMDQAAEEGRRNGNREIELTMRANRGTLLLEVGNPAAALVVLDEVHPRLEEIGGFDAERLRRLLVEPLGLKARRVLISPDRALYRVPFCLLLPGTEVAFVPSATTWGLLRAERPERGEGTLALGDPDYTGRGLADLPSTRAEARAIGSEVLLGAAATEEAFWKKLDGHERWHAVHLACHGLPDHRTPMQSALALTQADPDDGLLAAFEVVRRRVAADLVTLSARAFLFAGAPRVLVSLWKVGDAATGALVTEFYRLWADHPPDRALRLAREHVAAQERWRDPGYWAAWQLWGLPD